METTDYIEGFAHGQRVAIDWASHPLRGPNEIRGRSHGILYEYPLDPSDWICGLLDGQRNILDNHPKTAAV